MQHPYLVEVDISLHSSFKFKIREKRGDDVTCDEKVVTIEPNEVKSEQIG